MPNLAGAVVVYALVAAAFFAHAGTRLIEDLLGTDDAYAFLWNAWWLRRSLSALTNPYFCSMIYAPYGSPLVWHSLTPLPSLAIAGLSHALPIQAAYNLVLMAAFPLAGASAFALCRFLTRDGWASLVGGLAFMLCPFMASKTAGHLNLLFCGLLPFYLLALLRATDPFDSASPARRRWMLAVASGCLLLSCLNAVVFAANLTLLLWLWQTARGGGLRATTARFWQALSPTLWIALPYAALTAYFTVSHDYYPVVLRDLAWNPEPISFLLPLTSSSVYSRWAADLGFPDLGGIEPAAYLGLLTLPLALLGLCAKRREPALGFCGLAFVVFTVFSLGPKLLWQREVVELGSTTVYLPFALWRLVPGLGAVGQSARYLVIAYAMIGVGVACSVAWLRVSLARRHVLAGAATAGAALGICADFAFRPMVTQLEAPLISTREGRVLDPRDYSPSMLYQQTLHEREIVGGYLARRPTAVLARYRSEIGVGWFFARDPEPAPGRAPLLASLRALDVSDVVLAQGDWREPALERLGFSRELQIRDAVRWRIPAD